MRMTLRTMKIVPMKGIGVIRSKGFTLFELVIVLAIIAAMIAVVLPYVSQRNDAMRVDGFSHDLADAIRYAIDLAEAEGSTVKLVIDTANNGYCLQQADNNVGYRAVKGFIGEFQYFNDDVRIDIIEGFVADGRSVYLLFDPSQRWPDARFRISTENSAKTIIVNGKNIEIEDPDIWTNTR